MDTLETVKDILMQVIHEDSEMNLSEDWFLDNIEWNELDSLKIVNFMLQIEETFCIYIDETSMAQLDFTQSYQILVNGVVNIVREIGGRNV